MADPFVQRNVARAAGTRRRKWRKPKDKPKPPLSAYNIFVERQMTLYKRATENVSNNNQSKLVSSVQPWIENGVDVEPGTEFGNMLFQRIAAQWNSLDAESRLKYEMEASKDQQRYAKEIDEWQRRKFQLGEEIIEECQPTSAQSADVTIHNGGGRSPSKGQEKQRQTSPTTNNIQTVDANCRTTRNQYADGIEEWRQRKFQLGAERHDQRDMRSSAFPSSVVGKFMGIGDARCGQAENLKGHCAELSDNLVRGRYSGQPPNQPIDKPPLREDMEATMLASSSSSSSSPHEASLAFRSSANGGRGQQVSQSMNRYSDPDSLAQLASQFDNDEIEFLASLRHAS